MSIALSSVTEQRVLQCHQDRLEVQSFLATQGVTASVKLLETAAYVGSVFRGNTEVLIEIKVDQWSCALFSLKSCCQPITESCWTAEYVQLRMKRSEHREIELTLVKSDTPSQQRMSARIEALKKAECRARYDVARRHVGALDDDAYARVQDLFWTTRGKSGPRWVEVQNPILKILREPEWEELLELEETHGAPVDIKDGYVHFSTPQQVLQTARKHFRGEKELWLLTLDVGRLNNLEFEVSRGGDLFPHLYASLKLEDVCLARPWSDTKE